MTGATVQATLTVTAAPVERTGRRSSNPPGKSSPFAVVAAKGDDCSPIRWQLFGFTPTARAALAKLRIDDLVTVKGRLAIRVDQHGAPVVAVECRSMRSPKTVPRESGRCGATRMADPARVQAANEAFYRKHGGCAP